jgi:hypothetical protein
MEFKETLDMLGFLKPSNLNKDTINTLNSMMSKLTPNRYNKDIIDVEVVDEQTEVKELVWKK